ncbi:PQQ-dependent sugar dehydrogenase, partial [candidate division KSB1 bacterium]|nr:PQQ-dependent sugar dehydrogenase [candidate division KSB1 bacterium]
MLTTKVTSCILLILLFLPSLRAGENVTLVKAFPNLSFDSPVFFCHSNDGTNRIFVVEQRGVIRVFPNDSTTFNTEVFLDIDGRVTSGGEMGLLGLAFHPNYSGNGYFYL